MSGHSSGTTKGLTAALVSAAALLLLSGCSLLGPTRGEDGRYTEPVEINSADLAEGDCFTFLEGTNLSKSTVVPCADAHEYKVIGEGTLDAAAIDSAGGKQNAVNAACDEPFAAFKETVAEGVKPEQQFITAQVVVEEVELTKYSCLATDAAAVDSAQG